MQIEPTWITYDQAERLVGLSRVTLYRLARSGAFKVAKVGTATRINRQSLEAYLERIASSESPKG